MTPGPTLPRRDVQVRVLADDPVTNGFREAKKNGLLLLGKSRKAFREW